MVTSNGMHGNKLPQPKGQKRPKGQKPMSETEANKPENTSQRGQNQAKSTRRLKAEIPASLDALKIPTYATADELVKENGNAADVIVALAHKNNRGRFLLADLKTACAAHLGIGENSFSSTFSQAKAAKLAEGKPSWTPSELCIPNKPGRGRAETVSKWNY